MNETFTIYATSTSLVISSLLVSTCGTTSAAAFLNVNNSFILLQPFFSKNTLKFARK
jgi:hypothetical protein